MNNVSQSMQTCQRNFTRKLFLKEVPYLVHPLHPLALVSTSVHVLNMTEIPQY